MLSSNVGNAATFLVETLFSLYILVVMLRFLFQLFRADFYNPLSQFVVAVTNPVLIPMRRFIPGYAGIDLSAVVLMLALKMLELWLVLSMLGRAGAIPGIFVLSIAELLSLTINVFFFSILIQVIISWINPGTYNPIMSLLHSLNEPVLRPARRAIPPIAGLDVSPVVVLIAFQLAGFLVINPIRQIAQGLM